MTLDQCDFESCVALIGVDETWATIYSIDSKEPGKGHATELLARMKAHYEGQGKTFGSSVALNKRMSYLLQKLNIPEYC